MILFLFPSAPYTNESCHLQHEASAARTASVSSVTSLPADLGACQHPLHPGRAKTPLPPQLPQIQMVWKTLTALTGCLSIPDIAGRQLSNLSVVFFTESWWVFRALQTLLWEAVPAAGAALPLSQTLKHIFFTSWASSPFFFFFPSPKVPP